MIVREATFDDYDGIMSVRRGCGLTERDRPSWEHHWTGNPHWAPETSIGWVIEDSDDRILGTFVSIPVGYQLGSHRLIAGVGNSYAVLPDGRKRSLQLVTEFCNQKHVDLLLSSTPAPMVAELLQRLFGALRAPYPEDTGILSWITNYRQFASALLRRRAGPLAGGLGYLAGPTLWTSDTLRRRARSRHRQFEVQRLDEFDERFDTFWSRLAKSQNRLLAVRDRATLAWHFPTTRTPGREILALQRADELLGYAVLIRKDQEPIGLKRLRICDLQTLEDDPSHVESLVSAAMTTARHSGIHMVEVMGHDAFRRSVFERLKPHRRQGGMRCLYWPKNPKLADPLLEPETWALSPYDGDNSL
jgi:hypothetical protein